MVYIREMNWELDLGMRKMARYAAYQDRSRRELVTKLRQIGCPEEKQEEVLEELERLGFWDEERFARSFTRGKFRQKGWGRMKIRQGLWAKGVENALADVALEEEIDEEEYRVQLGRELEKRLARIDGEPDREARQKLIQSLAQRGFERDVILDVWREITQ